jgi:hypothetical protein
MNSEKFIQITVVCNPSSKFDGMTLFALTNTGRIFRRDHPVRHHLDEPDWKEVSGPEILMGCDQCEHCLLQRQRAWDRLGSWLCRSTR